MAQGISLDAAVLNFNSLRDHARQRLVKSLEEVPGRKALVLDPTLSGPLALVAQTSLLKEHGVDSLFHISTDPIPSQCPAIVYLLRPRLQLLQCVQVQIRADEQHRTARTYHAFFVPRCSLACRRVLETGELSRVALGEYPLQFFPYEDDTISLELDSAFKDFHVDHVHTSMLEAARALAAFQTVFGVAPLIKGKGEAAQVVADATMRIMREQKGTVPPLPQSAISMVLMLDRKVDLVTPMCTQLTYEGLIDEILHIQNSSVEVDPSVVAASQSPAPSQQHESPSAAAKKVKVPLNSSDKLFLELRDANWGVAADALRAKAVRMQADYASIKTTSAAKGAGGEEQGTGPGAGAGTTSQGGAGEQQGSQSVSDLKEFVKKLNALPELTRHTNLAQHIAKFTNKPSFGARLAQEQNMLESRNFEGVCECIEDMIGRQEPIARVIRMLVLLSVTGGGIPKPKFDFFRREIVQSYGLRYMLPLSCLEGAGLVRRQEVRTTTWQTLKRALRLVVEDDDDANPRDVAFMFSGYAPISIRLVQHALEGGWRAIEEPLRSLPGPVFEFKQSVDGCERSEHPEPLRRKASGDESKRRVVVVVFLGGVTYAEIAALRFLSRKEGSSTDFVVITTKFVSGSSLLTNILEPLY